jgi:hypothetical protein
MPEKVRNPGYPAADNLLFVEAVLLLRDAPAILAEPVMLQLPVADPWSSFEAFQSESGHTNPQAFLFFRKNFLIFVW